MQRHRTDVEEDPGNVVTMVDDVEPPVVVPGMVVLLTDDEDELNTLPVLVITVAVPTVVEPPEVVVDIFESVEPTLDIPEAVETVPVKLVIETVEADVVARNKID